MIRDSLLDGTLHVMNPSFGVTNLGQVGLNISQVSDAPNVPCFTWAAPRQHVVGATAVPSTTVDRSWASHALKGVIEIKLAFYLTTIKEALGGRHHAASSPDAALHDRAPNRIDHQIV